MWGTNNIQLFMANAQEFNDKNQPLVLFDNNMSKEKCPYPTQHLTASVSAPNLTV